MKNVAITMRIDNNLEYNEKRDCLDTNWYKLFNICNLNLILIPNNLLLLELILSNNKIDGFLFSGGNNINDKYTIERDYIEKKIIEFSIQNNIPILGICRGMQAIGNYFNLKLRRKKL